MISKLKRKTNEPISILTKKLYYYGIKPNHLTLLGLILGSFSSLFIIYKNIPLAVSLLTLSCIFDILDGNLARNFNLQTKFGAFIDSVSDRFVDAFVLTSLGYTFKINYFLITLNIFFCLMVSYTRARAECFIEKCDVGICERGERLFLVLIGLTFNVVNVVIYLILALSIITILQRIYFTYKMCR